MNFSQSSIFMNEYGCKRIISPDSFMEQFPVDRFYALLIVAMVFDLATCPWTILLNTLVIMAVKIKGRLQTHNNILLACLAFTDLMVGLVVQPLHLATTVFLLQGRAFHEFCETQEALAISVSFFGSASQLHVALVSGERYLAVKHTFIHNTFVTKPRMIAISVLAWVGAALLFCLKGNIYTRYVALFLVGTIICLIIWFQIVVYREVKRHEKHILSQQVSEEARAKFRKEKKAFKLTTRILLALLLCFFLPFFCRIFTLSFGKNISTDIRNIVLFLTKVPIILNSFINPVIYIIRIKEFRVAFVELLLRKSFQEAEQLERRLFRLQSNQIASLGAVQEGREQEADRNIEFRANNQEDNLEILTPDVNFDDNTTAPSPPAQSQN